MKGFCLSCSELLADDNQVSQHTFKTSHKVKILTTMEQSILMFCHVNKNVSYLKKHRSLVKSSLKRSLATDDQSETVSKQKRLLEDNSEETYRTHATKIWMCQCRMTFPSEELAERHVFSSNRICHKCAVCGKLAESAGIIRLHMSRFHGGAHLADFRFWCQSCHVDLQKGDDVMVHVSEFHDGHSHFCERYVSEDELALSSNSLTDTACDKSLEIENQPSSPMDLSPPASPMDLSEEPSDQGKWQCCLCEEIFDSEDTVQQHCLSLESHNFPRYSCDVCKATFRKAETLHRHCQEKHNSVTRIKYFCGFCGDLFFDSEEEFVRHFKGFHSTDYICVCPAETSIKVFETVEESSLLNCGCREKYASKQNRNADYKKCQEAMLAKGNLWFRCTSCSSTAQNHSDIITHLTSHPRNKAGKEPYVVRCGACNRHFSELGVAHQHYHAKHCFSQKPKLDFGSPVESEVFQFSASGSCVDKKDEKLKLSAAVTAPRSKSLSPKTPGAVKKEVLGQGW